METLELFTLVLAFTLSLALYHRRRRHQLGRVATSIKVRDHAAAQQALIDHGDAFANRPSQPFPVSLFPGRRRRGGQRHGITTVPYGPHWRALRSNINAAILQPWRQGLLAPFQQDAVDAVVTGLLTGGGGGDDDVVVIRDSLYPAVFAMLTRVCFGDDVDAVHVRSMERMMHEFMVAIGEARVFARSAMAKLTHWKKWRRFLAFRSRQVAMFAPLIAARRRHNDDGSVVVGSFRPYVDSLIDLCVPHEDDPRTKRALTEDEIVSLMVENLGAADSIVAVLEWTLAHLVTQPEVQAKLRREVAGGGGGGGSTYLHAVVLEGLRLHPPFPLVVREVRSESEGAVPVVGAAAVPAAGGTRVQFMLGDIGKDKRLWTDPDDFRPERFLPGGEGEDVSLVPAGQKQIKMMPFGAGHRACPGAAMGVHFIKGFLAALVREFEWAAAAPPGDGGVDMTELYGFITVMKSPLRAHITPCA